MLGAIASHGCAAGGAPRGATLRLQFIDVRAGAVDQVRVSLTPQGTERFLMQPIETFEGITTTVGTDGTLSLSIPGDVFRANAQSTGPDDASPSFDLEVWSDDRTRNTAPQMRATVTQGTEVIAQGVVFLPEWPLVLGATTSVPISCNSTTRTQCDRR